MVTLPASRRGASKVGCLVPLVVLGLLLYAGVLFGKPWFRYQQWRDDFNNSAGFATTLSDSAIRSRLAASADSLNLPEAAKRHLNIQRLPRPARIEIRSEYTETVHLPWFGDKVLTFKPFAEADL